MKGKQVQQLIKYHIIISLLFFSSFLSALEVGMLSLIQQP